MNTTSTSDSFFQSVLPHELVGIIASHLLSPHDLANFARASRTCHIEATPHLYSSISFAPATSGSRATWIKTIVLWARTMKSNGTLAHKVEKLVLHVPEADFPAMFRQTLDALQACVNLRDLELYRASHRIPPFWLLPEAPRFKLTSFATDISAYLHLGRFLESQPSIRKLLLEAFDMRLSLKPGTLPLLTSYNGFTMLISGARPPGTVWENLTHAELRDAYRWEKGLLDSMPHLRVLDITVAAAGGDLLSRIAEKCAELRVLTLRDGNGLLHDRHELGDGRLSGVTLLPEFAKSFSNFRHLSSLTIDPVYKSRNHAPASTEHKHLIRWHRHCPTLCHFISSTGRQWIYLPSTHSSADLSQWVVLHEPASNENIFATDPGLFGMRRPSEIRERSDGGSMDELIAIIERLNRQRVSG
ncbi:hypothetical protein RhiJN_01252 [Ceratobasidium sp. AG-Ba]|nr:hypothetical protein RhiJN_01252 [Ceratobasidium sp. AG-Ba]